MEGCTVSYGLRKRIPWDDYRVWERSHNVLCNELKVEFVKQAFQFGEIFIFDESEVNFNTGYQADLVRYGEQQAVIGRSTYCIP